MKKFLSGVVIGAIITTSVLAFAATIKKAEYNDTTISLNGEKLVLDQQFVSITSEENPDFFSNYMPLRAVLETLGYDVEWDNDTKNVNLTLSSEKSDSEIIGEEKITVKTEKYESKEHDIEYLVVSGMADTKKQDTINELLESFYTWPTIYLYDEDEDVPSVTVKANYAILGDYLSATLESLSLTEDAAYPNNSFNAITFNLKTGETVDYDTFIKSNSDLLDAVESGKFEFIYPGEGVEDADKAFLVDYFAEARKGDEINKGFYLTEDSFGLFVGGKTHAEGGYWTFESEYDDIADILTEQLTSVFAK